MELRSLKIETISKLAKQQLTADEKRWLNTTIRTWCVSFKPYVDYDYINHYDLTQEIFTIAIETSAGILEIEGKKYKNAYSYINARLYKFLKNNGYRRPKHSKSYIYSNKLLVAKANNILEKDIKDLKRSSRR